MKKFLVAILAFFYLGSAAGVFVHMHPCTGGLQASNHEAGHPVEKHNDCCTTENIFLGKIIEQEARVSAMRQVTVMVSAIPVSSFEMAVTDYRVKPAKNAIAHIPIQHNSVPIYISNCVFLI